MRGVIREILSGLKQQPVALLMALVVLPSAWYVPADLLYDRLIPEDAQASGTAPLWLNLALLAACTVWSCVLYAGQLQIAIDSVRGSPVRWRRFREGVPHTFRIAVTTLPLALPFGGMLALPDGDWLDMWALPLLLGTLVSALTLTARTVSWAPWAIDGRLSLRSSLIVSWIATRAQTWRIVRLGFALTAPLVPLFVLEMLVLGESWLASGLIGALYTLATAHLYVLIPAKPELTVSSPTNGELAVPSDLDAELPRTGTGWTRPYD